MDIAKYLATAVLLTSVFNDIENAWVIYLSVTISIVITLVGGLWLLRDNKDI